MTEGCCDLGPAPFPLLCSGCGADIDAPDQFFKVSYLAYVPHAEHALVSLRCLSCGRVHELALWMIEGKVFRQQFEGWGEPDQEHRAETLALAERYRAMVAGFRRDAGEQFAESEESPLIEFPLLELNFPPGRFSVVPMMVLAAGRTLRQAVAERPGLAPPVRLALSRSLCILSFDKTDGRPQPWALHLSVGNGVAPGHFPAADERWLISLFFSAGEVPFLEAFPGVSTPVMHYWLPAYVPELNVC